MKYVPKPPPKIPFTQAAYAKLQSELDRLTQYREEVITRLTTAREMGDLSENGAYRYAKMELGDTNRQMRQLKYQLRFGYVPGKPTGGTVSFGSNVTLENEEKHLSFMLVSKHESDPRKNKLSTESPVGQAVQGKKVGDEVIVKMPFGETKYRITKID